MGKGLSTAAFVMVLTSCFVPLVGTWVCYIGLIIAALAALFGSTAWVIATTTIAAVNLYLLTPSLMTVMYLPFTDSEAPTEAYLFFILTTALVALPIVCLIFRSSLKPVLRKFGILKSEPA